MLNLQLPTRSLLRATPPALRVLEQQPTLCRSLRAESPTGLSRLSHWLAPVIAEGQQAQRYYIQAITVGTTTFLATNLVASSALAAKISINLQDPKRAALRLGAQSDTQSGAQSGAQSQLAADCDPTAIQPETEVGISPQITPEGHAWLIGRRSSCPISLGFASVSRFHAVLGKSQNEGFYIVDTGSKNGTFVNGQRLVPHQRRTLHAGDRMRFSHLELDFVVSSLPFIPDVPLDLMTLQQTASL
jgi:pSer/pThr/pTyr-binding forkhead associated (FHA) protein